MALSSAIVWEIRTSGSSNNGGGFKAGASGTDYSQQDSAQYSPSSALSTSGSSAVIAYAAASADMVGNIINITAGTNFTTGRYEIISAVAGVSITVDRNATSGAASGGSGFIGGAATLINAVTNAVVQGNTVWIKDSGSAHVLTAACTLNLTNNNTLAALSVFGYGSARGDKTRPTVTSATNSVVLFSLNGTGYGLVFEDIIFTHSATTRGPAIDAGFLNQLLCLRCQFDGVDYAVRMNGAGQQVMGVFAYCEFKNVVTRCIGSSRGGRIYVFACNFHDNTTATAIHISGNSDHWLSVERCIFDTNSAGIFWDGSHGQEVVTVDSCVFYNNSGHGFEQNSTTVGGNATITNSIFYLNGGYGIKWNATKAPNWAINQNNAFGSNTSGAYSSLFTAGTNEVTLTADPFTDAANRDFTLNTTSGGGAACKGAGTPATIP